MLIPWQPVRDLCFIRELPVRQTGLIVAPIDLNRSKDNTTWLQGRVEAVGPKVTTVAVGDLVWYEIEMGEFRVPGDDMVRIMYEGQIAAIEPLQVRADYRPCSGCGSTARSWQDINPGVAICTDCRQFVYRI
jgi:hypothetical protein